MRHPFFTVVVAAVLLLCIATAQLVIADKVPYKAFDPFPMLPTRPVPVLTQSQQATLNTLLSMVSNNWQGCIVTHNATLLSQYAEDYGHAVHHVPNAVFQPKNTADVSLLIKKVYKLNKNRPSTAPLPIRIVTRGAGGNVLGAAQVLEAKNVLSVLLDMSVMTSVSNVLTRSHSVWADAGSTWLQVLERTETVGMRPLVMPDYLGITVGGVESIGGWGGDSAVRGPCVDHIKQIEVVTSQGHIIVCSRHTHKHLFDAVRGGMGQFGVMTRVRLTLEHNEPHTRVYHMMSTSLDFVIGATKKVYKKLMKKKVQGQVLVDTMQTFVIPNQVPLIRVFALFGNQEILKEEVNRLAAHQQPFVYMIELTTRFSSESEALSMDQLIQKLGLQFDLVFALDMDTHSWDNRLEIGTIPALVQTGQWFKRHTWLNIFLTEQVVRNELESVLNNFNISNTGGGHIGLYPIRIDRVNRDTFVSIPNAGKVRRDEKWVYLLILGRDETTDTEAGFQQQLNGNRIIWNQFSTVQSSNHKLVTASVYPTNMVPNWGPADWRAHFGDKKWNQFKRAKQLFDPNYVFADTRSFGF